MLTAALLVALSVPGVLLARWLLRPLAPYATSAAVFAELFEPDEPETVSFGFDSSGLVD